MNEGCDPTAEIRADDYSQSSILQRDEPVLLPYRSRRGFDVADVGIDTIGIERRRDRTGGYQLMREDVVLNLRTRDACGDHLPRQAVAQRREHTLPLLHGLRDASLIVIPLAVIAIADECGQVILECLHLTLDLAIG